MTSDDTIDGTALISSSRIKQRARRKMGFTHRGENSTLRGQFPPGGFQTGIRAMAYRRSFYYQFAFWHIEFACRQVKSKIFQVVRRVKRSSANHEHCAA